MIGEEQDRCRDDLIETARTGERAFDRLYGRPVFDYLGEHPEPAEIFAVRPAARRRAGPPAAGAAGVAGRCGVAGGVFVEAALGGADAYLLGHILHDWDDAQAGPILDNLRRAMPAAAELLLVEDVLPEGDGASFGKWLPRGSPDDIRR
jgi:hypothetical protein